MCGHNIHTYIHIYTYLYIHRMHKIEWSFFFLHTHMLNIYMCVYTHITLMFQYKRQFDSSSKNKETEKKQKKKTFNPNLQSSKNLVHKFNSIWCISTTFASIFLLICFCFLRYSHLYCLFVLLKKKNCDLFVNRLYSPFFLLFICFCDRWKNLVCVSIFDHRLMTKRVCDLVENNTIGI